MASMDYHYFKNKLNRFYLKYVDGINRPTFFNIDETYPSLNNITNQIEIIKKEFHHMHAHSKNLPRYHDIDPGELNISNTTAKNWNVFMVYLLGYELPKAREFCPEVSDLVRSIPNIIQAFFSILEPGKSIPKHEGPYLGYLRYHLGIHVPKDNPPKIIVNNQPYIWKPGEAVLFDDSWPHEVINQSDDFRAVLIIDVLRPLPLLPHLINLFTTQIIARYTYGRKTMNRAKKYNEDAAPLVS